MTKDRPLASIMETSPLTNQLATLFRHGRHYDFLVNGYRALSRSPNDSPLATLVLRALVELQLGGPARELFKCRRELGGLAEAGQLYDQLRRVPDGRRPWSVARVLFERNREALLSRYGDLQSVIDSLHARLTKLQMHRSCSGDILLSILQADGLRDWRYLISTGPSDERMELPERGQMGPVVVVGVRTGNLFDRLNKLTSRLFLEYSHPIYVVETDLTRFAAWMHAGDHTLWLTNPRVHWHVGEDAAEGLKKRLIDGPRLPMPGCFINQTGTETDGVAIREKVEAANTDRQRRFEQAIEALRRRYADRDRRYWTRRYASPKSVIGVTSRYTTMLQFSMRDTLAALERIGWRSHLMIECSNHEQFAPVELCEAILKIDPDLIVLIDHLRSENPYLPANLPLLSWIQDPLPNLLNADAGRSIGLFDFACGYYKDRCTREFGYPADQFCSTVIPVSESVFHDGPITCDDRSRYACDVSFVSNASQPPDAWLAQSLANQPPHFQAILRSIYDEVLGALNRGDFITQHSDAPRLVRQVAIHAGRELTGTEIEQLTHDFAFRIFDWARRQQTLEWVSDWSRRSNRTLKIYGRDWRRHPRLAVHAAGVIEHGEPLRKANRASRLALQLVTTGFRHQRTFEVLACGTLPLTRYCPNDFCDLPIDEFVRQRDAGHPLDEASRFFPGMERITFDSPERFAAVAERFLKDDAYYREVLGDLRQVVMSRCTYGGIMPHVIEFIKNSLSNPKHANHNPLPMKTNLSAV